MTLPEKTVERLSQYRRTLIECLAQEKHISTPIKWPVCTIQLPFRFVAI